MSTLPFKKEDVIGVEPKHITYVTDQTGGRHDCLIAKLIVHTKDGGRYPILRPFEDYKRPFWITHKGMRNHQEKKDYELVKNLQKMTSTQLDLPHAIARQTGNYSAGPNPQLRILHRSPYVYGSDVSSTCYLKHELREKYPDLMSLNTVAGGDIESSVHHKDERIICMSVSHKEKVFLCYLDSWVEEIPNVEQATMDMAHKLIPDLIRDRKLEIEIKVVDSPGKVVYECMMRLHQWKPDFFGFWNMNFDITKMIYWLEAEGYNLADVFSDPSVPNKYRYFNYRRGPTQKVTASGKVMSLSIEDRWNWVTHPASFQCIDLMTVYRITRLANGKEPSYALDNILKKELNGGFSIKVSKPEDIETFKKQVKKLSGAGGFIYTFKNDIPFQGLDTLDAAVGDQLEVKSDFGKLKFKETDHLAGLRWHEVMQKDYKLEYAVYNIVDSVRLEQLDEKTKDLASSISMYSKSSDYKNFNSNPKRLTDDMHFWYLKRPEPAVIGTGSDQMSHELDQHVIGHDDWIVTLPSYMCAPEGLDCVKQFPGYQTLIFTQVADLDIVSTYPNVSQILNIARETCVMEFSRMSGISEQYRREVGVNLTAGRGNAVEIGQKILGAPSLDDMLAKFQAHKAKKETTGGGDLVA